MLLVSLLLTACGGSGSTTPPAPSVTHFSVSAPTPAVAGVPFQITVTALDASGNVVTSFNAGVTLTSSDAQAVLLPIGLVAGTGTGSITLQTPGSQTIVAHYNSISSTSNPITVNPSGPVASFMLSTPGTAVMGSPIQFTVTAIDANGLTVGNYSGTMKFSSSDPLAHLPGNSSLTSGTGNFSATMGTSGNATISATDTSSATLTGVSNSIAVSGPATHYSFNNVPASIYTRVQVTMGITALDASNNFATSYSGTAQLKSTDSTAILPSTATLANGAGPVNVVFESPGNQTLTATDTAKSSITATSSSVAVAAAPALVITSSAPPDATVGSNYYPHLVRVCLQYRLDPFPVCIRYGYKTVDGYPLVASGGVGTYSWSWAAASSSLPPGFSLQNNVITGTPPVGSVGNYPIIVTVTDSGTPPVNTPTPYTFTIQNPPPPVINSALLPPGATLNQPYSFTFAATQGLAPYSWSETGALPAGITFSSSGVLSGTPSAAGSSPITVNVEDSLQQKTATPLQVTLQVFAAGFHSAASMKSPRVQHTATLLENGKVLVTGGDNTNPSTGELYDPSGNTFTSVGNMSAAFDSHTATLLCDLSHLPCANDKVLIAGGPTSSAELFDPATSEFTPIANTVAQRMAATATLLPNGKVLLAGGTTVTTSTTPGVALSSAELFDPSTLTFAYTGTMVSARQNYTATLLSNGKVLLVGGLDDHGNTLASAELFDPSNNSFAPSAGSLHTARWSHTATPLPNGKVFITGGWDSTNQALASAEFYDPSTDSFSNVAAPMITPRADFTSTLLSNGTVLIVGGHDRNNNVFGNVEIFDPSSATFTSTGGLSTARYFHTATLLPGTAGVLVTGGYQRVSTGLQPLSSAEVYQ
jgi:hypothetical protein